MAPSDQESGGLSDGKRDALATALGAGAGAALGHTLGRDKGHETLATLGGLAVGAVTAHKLEEHEREKHAGKCVRSK